MSQEIAALKVKGLDFAYGKKKVLDQVDFSINASECRLLLGPNGAGKSTLFSLITRLYDTSVGEINLSGFDVKKQSGKALSTLGVVFQQTTLDLDLTVMQNLYYHAALHGIGRKAATHRIQDELERLSMYERRFEKVRQLNGGHKRRVEIARALLHKPSLLLLDEPTVGLDMSSRQAIVDHIHRLASEQHIAVLWATHLMDEVSSEDQLIILHQGKIREKGSVKAILERTKTASIEEAFKQLTQGRNI